MNQTNMLNDFYNENYKALKKVSEEDTIKWEDPCVHGSKLVM
jgi:hypothetical protein